MAVQISLSVGSWYQAITGERFEVVAYDIDDGTVEIQYFDGTVEELDIDDWQSTVLCPVSAPEDWSGSVDIQAEDYLVEFDTPKNGKRGNPLDSFD